MTELFRHVAERPESRALTRGLWGRRATMTVFVVIVLLAAVGFVGQRGTTTHAAAPAATLSLGAPKIVRGGLFFQARIEVVALKAIDHPRFVLGRGWAEGMQVNSTTPGPMSEASRDGLIVWSYPALAAGDKLSVWVQFQVDPTEPGRRDFSLELDDAQRALARVARKVTVLP
jgi:hypothetical protein